MMKRTKLCDRALPVYSVGEELVNTATHVIGGLLGVLCLVEFFIHDAFSVFMPLISVFATAEGVATGYTSTIASLLLTNIWRIVLVLLPVILFAVFSKGTHRGWKRSAILAVCAAVLYGGGIGLVHAVGLDTAQLSAAANFDGTVHSFGLSMGGVLNIILDYAFILGLGMGTEGAGLATILAQFLSGFFCIIYIRRKVPVLRISRHHFKCTAADWRRHLQLGLPMGFQSSIIAIGMVVVQFALNSLGTTEIAAYTAAMKLDNLGILPLMSFGIAMATYVGQNHGAEKPHRIRQGIFQCCIISIIFSVFIGIIAQKRKR